MQFTSTNINVPKIINFEITQVKIKLRLFNLVYLGTDVSLLVTNLAPGAGNGIRVGLQNLLNDNSEEAKLLAYQLGFLKSHFELKI